MILTDLYSQNYAGELETILIEKDNVGQIVFKVKLFQADFNVITSWIPYDTASHSDNLAFLLNTDLDWGEDFSEVLRLQEFYDQLQMVVSHIDAGDLDIYNAIKNICESTLQHNNRLYIKLHN